jgi:hypothetical protein
MSTYERLVLTWLSKHAYPVDDYGVAMNAAIKTLIATLQVAVVKGIYRPAGWIPAAGG